jgi:hypothetical protein
MGRESDQLIPEAKTEKTSHRWGKMEEDILPAGHGGAKEKRGKDQAAVVSGSIRAMFLK